MNTQKYNVIDHQFHSCFEIVQGYGEMSSEINVIVRCAREYNTSSLLFSSSVADDAFFSGPRVKLYR